MDLVEIRKKSKKKLSKKQADAPSETSVAGPEAGQSRVSEEPDQDRNRADANGSIPVKTKPDPSAPSVSATEQDRSALDVLDALFATSPDLTLATEENYLQGLEKDEVETRDQQQWLTFGLGKEQYAIDIVFVREIIKPREITDIPRVPEFILGVISLRGVVVPIYDLRRRISLGAVEIDNRSRIIVCEQGERIAGLLVDNITQVVSFSTGEIEPPPAILSGLDRELVEGVGRVSGKMVILLDLPSVLDVELS